MAWRTEVWGQYTTDRLPSVEEYFLGDRYGLRGYRFDEANADSGVAALIEVSRSFFLEGRRLRRIGTFAFLDAGHVENNDPADFEVDSVTLVSTGIGLDFEFASAVYVSGYAAVPLRDGPLTDANSPAAYLSLTTSW